MVLLFKNLKWSLFYRSEGGPWVAARQSLHLQSPPIKAFVIKFNTIMIMKVEVMKILYDGDTSPVSKTNERMNKKPSPPRDGAGRLHDLQDPEMSFGQYLFFKNAALFIFVVTIKMHN